MDFFKSVFSDDDSQSKPSDSHATQVSDHDEVPEQSGIWSFGGLVKTLATKSESVIQNYRRDLEGFGSGLKKETDVIRQVASRAVKELPATLDVGASVAQKSLESVGQAVDDIGSKVWKSTAEIISQGRDTLLAADLDSDSSENNNNIGGSSSQTLDLKRYSRYESQLRAIQCDMNTYLEEPEDSENFYNWKLEFPLDEKGEEIEDLVKENEVVREIYGKIVPSRIDREWFWSRYFYRVHKLQKAEEARAKLVKRAINGDEEEHLSWDFDDEDEQEDGGNNAIEPMADSENKDENVEESLKSENNDTGFDFCRDSDVSVVSSQPSMPGEEDIGWDKIEDIGIDESKGDSVGTTVQIDLRKRLSLAEEEGDLSWDIEEDDEPGKS